MSTDHLPSVQDHRTEMEHVGVDARWADLVAGFVSRQDSENTRRAYRRHLLAFAHADLSITDGDDVIHHLAPVVFLGDLSVAHLMAYREQITSSGLSPASQAQALAALRRFLKWTSAVGGQTIRTETITETLKTPSGTTLRPYAVLTEAEITRVLKQAATPRDRALFAVMLGAGLRASEVVNLDIADIHQTEEGMLLHVHQGKGRKDRNVPVGADVAGLVFAQLEASGWRLGDDGPLFQRADRAGAGGRLTARALGQLVARTASAAGVKGKACSPHTMRHTYALRTLRAGANVVQVSKLLGHSSIVTTQRYVDHMGLDELRAVVPSLPLAT